MSNTRQSSLPEVLCKKGILKNFAKFTEKQLCQSFFFNKAAGLRSVTLLKKRLWHKCFSVNFAKFLGTPFFTEFFTEHLRWLLLLLFPMNQTNIKILFPFLQQQMKRWSTLFFWEEESWCSHLPIQNIH